MNVAKLMMDSSTTPAGSATDVLRASVAHLGAADIAQLLHALAAGNGATLPIREDADALWFNLAAARVNRCIRAARLAQNAVDEARSAAERAFLRQQLVARQRVLAIAEDGAWPSEPPPMPQEDAVTRGVRRVYELVLHRRAGAAEVDIWKGNMSRGTPFEVFLQAVDDSQEAKNLREQGEMSQLSDAEYVQTLYEVVLGRAAHPRELAMWQNTLDAGHTTRTGLLRAILAAGIAEDSSAGQVHDALSCWIMGTSKTIHLDDWAEKAKELSAEHGKIPAAKAKPFSRFHIKAQPRVLVSAIASLYRGADFIEQFMENITTQTVFDEYCELVIVDADSPENEEAVIRRYMKKHKNIQYLRMNYRIGIYDAWNVGAKAARGDFLTNTNLDDLRRRDSLELQASVLDNLDFVDVTYQDFHYSFDPSLTPEQVASFGYTSNLPVITPANMLAFNSPHNAPMWRKRLHDELGYFDTHFRSAGDYDFWLRCVAAGKTFFKLNDPHVIYYQNPEGLSTRADTRGVVEGREVHRRFSRKLVSPNLTMSSKAFGAGVLGLPPTEAAQLPTDLAQRYGIVQAELRQIARTAKFTGEAE